MNEADPGSVVWRRVAKVAIGVVVTIACVELLLQVASITIPQVRWVLLAPWEKTAHLPDPVLLFKGNPELPEHDRLGFRNEVVPERVDIVAIGDSQTYGTGVGRNEAWPAQLSIATGKSIYNLSVGGWGPVQYWRNAEQALAFKPRTVVVGLYVGNDLYDAYNVAYRLESGASLRDAERLSAIRALESTVPLDLQPGVYEGGGDRRPEDADPSAGTLRTLLSQHLKLYALLRSYWHLASGGYDAGFTQWTVESRADYWARLQKIAADHPTQMVAFDSEGLRTILTPQYRMAGVNIADLRIAEGVEVTRRALRAMRDLCTSRGARLLVVVLPTKEFVFAPYLTGSGLDPAVARASADVNMLEEEMRRRIFAFLDADKIDYVDALPSVRRTIAEKEGNPFFESRNGHFSALGQRAIAQAIAAHPAIR